MLKVRVWLQKGWENEGDAIIICFPDKGGTLAIPALQWEDIKNMADALMLKANIGA